MQNLQSKLITEAKNSTKKNKEYNLKKKYFHFYDSCCGKTVLISFFT